MHLVIIIVVLVALILFLLVLACLCKNVFVPLLGRLKNRMLVEEHGLENSKDKQEDNQEAMEVPPSSDRQGIHPTPDTEDKM
jgi:hypothetical protein